MSWSSRFNLGRFSPFTGRPTEPPKVTEADYSYITDADLQEEQERTRRNRPAKDTDVLIFKYQRTNYPVHFGAYAIDDGDLTVGAARDAAAKKIDADPRRVRLFWKGKKLADNSRTCAAEGLRSADQAEILTILGDTVHDDEDDDDEDGDETDDDAPASTPDKKKKKRKNRKRKAKKAPNDLDSGQSTPNVEHLPVPSGTHPLHKAENSTAEPARTGGPTPPAAAPKTPREKLQALTDHLRNELAPVCERYIADPPADKDKREFEYKKCTEIILAQVVLKTDAVETEGDEELRALRKALVREAQDWFNKLDAVPR